jgi:probable rRNA maturation factor
VITFHFEGIGFRLKARRSIRSWIEKAVAQDNFKVGELSFVFCSDERLLAMNRQFLQHNYYTDIITFNNSEGAVLSGEMVISVDRVRDNARTLGARFEDELHRVMAHGTLHLSGLKDGTKREQAAMRAAENRWLEMRNVPRGTKISA